MFRRLTGSLLVLFAFLAVWTVGAKASYYMTYRQAKAETNDYAAELCRGNCIRSASGPCRRRSPSGFSCVMIHRYAFLKPWPSFETEESECHTLLHWGVNSYTGRIVLRGTSEPYCF